MDSIVPTRHPRHRHKRASSPFPNPTATPAPTLTRSNLGPLTTTFTPPAQCTRAILACSTCDIAWKALSCGSDAAPQDDTACWPRATSYAPRSQPAFSGLGFYSPGLLCPTGYTSACTAVSTLLNESALSIATPGPMKDGSFQFPLIEGEMAVGCCPTGYTCATYSGHGWQTCHQVATSTKLDAMRCDSQPASVNEIRIPIIADSQTITKIDVWAPLIQINRQASDLPVDVAAIHSETVPSSSATPTYISSIQTTALLAESTSLPNTASPVSPTPAPTKHSTLSLSAIAGIAISSVIIFLCLISILVYLWARKRYLRPPTHFTPANGPNGKADPTSPDPSISSSAPIVPGKVHSLNAFSTPISGVVKEWDTRSAAPSSRLSMQALGYDFPLPLSKQDRMELPPYRSRSNTTATNDTSHTSSTIQTTSTTDLASLSSDGQIILDTHAMRFGRSLGVEDDLESPIDGTSPFRLKRGNTVRKQGSLRSVKSVRSGRGRLVEVSPLSRMEDKDMKEDENMKNRSMGSGNQYSRYTEECSWEREVSVRGLAL